MQWSTRTGLAIDHSRPQSIGRFRSLARCPLAIAAAGLLAGCSRSPSQDILGSFFPSWLLCLIGGAVAAALLRACLFAIGLGEHVVAPLITYPAVALAVTFLTWLVWFGN